MESELDRDKETLKQRNRLIVDELNESKLQLDNLNEQLDQKKESNQKAARHLDGLMKRIQISHEIGGMIPYAIMFLLLCIETGPIFFKLMLIKGAYDYLEENQKLLARVAAGIEPNAQAITNEMGAVELVDIFHKPHRIINDEKNQYETQKILSQQIHESYREKMKQDIDKYPEKYIEEVDENT